MSERTRRLDGRVALVTGAARGQGRAHAVRLAEQGADVIAVDLGSDDDVAALDETASLVRAVGRRVCTAVADVRTGAVGGAVAEAAGELGPVDIAVANAGIAFGGPTVEATDESWAALIDTNLSGAWHTVQAVLPAMVERRRGSIVLISSANGGIKAAPNLAGYSASKHGVVGLMRSLAAELAPLGIRVNSVHPTACDTAMIHNEHTYRMLRPDLADPGREDVIEVFRSFHALPIPWVDPRDVANAVAWLVSDEARYITGVALPVDAGLTRR